MIAFQLGGGGARAPWLRLCLGIRFLVKELHLFQPLTTKNDDTEVARLQKFAIKDGSINGIRFVSTVRYASIFSKEYGTSFL